MSTTKSVTEIVGAIVDLLSPLGSDERQRVVRASLTLLGDQVPDAVAGPRGKSEEIDHENKGLHPIVRGWMKQNGLSLEQLQHVFHFSEGDPKFIGAEIPGKNNREKVRSAYVLLGIAKFLSSGDAKFEDKTARAFCGEYGLYDQTNHMKYMKGGNEFTGSKEKGWSVTKPGLKHGATLIKGLVGDL